MKVLQTVTEKFTVDNQYLTNALLAFETRISHIETVRPNRVQFELKESANRPEKYSWVVTFEYLTSAYVSDEPKKGVYSVPEAAVQEVEAA